MSGRVFMLAANLADLMRSCAEAGIAYKMETTETGFVFVAGSPGEMDRYGMHDAEYRTSGERVVELGEAEDGDGSEYRKSDGKKAASNSEAFAPPADRDPAWECPYFRASRHASPSEVQKAKAMHALTCAERVKRDAVTEPATSYDETTPITDDELRDLEREVRDQRDYDSPTYSSGIMAAVVKRLREMQVQAKRDGATWPIDDPLDASAIKELLRDLRSMLSKISQVEKAEAAQATGLRHRCPQMRAETHAEANAQAHPGGWRATWV